MPIFRLLLPLALLLGFLQNARAITSMQADVVVIGGGGAGLSAAVEAKLLGASVILVEKMPHIGGNTLLASGGINSAGSVLSNAHRDAQGFAAGGRDTIEIAYADTMKKGRWKNSPALAETLCRNSSETLDWLLALGADLRGTGFGLDASKARLHYPLEGRFRKMVGPEIIRTLYRKAYSEKVDIRTNTKALALLRNNENRVSGVRVRDTEGTYDIDAGAVVIATGGFAAALAKKKSTMNGNKEILTTNHPGATGDGLRMAKSVGADTLFEEELEWLPTVIPENAVIVPETLRRKGAVLLNRNADRFVNELADNRVVAEAIHAQPGGEVWLFFDSIVYSTFYDKENEIPPQSLLFASTLKALSETIGVDHAKLLYTLDGWEKSKAKGLDEFGRRSFPWALSRPPYYALPVKPAGHYTPGGLRIDTKTHVLNRKGKPVPGLFAAGEVTGGVHGEAHLPGNALTDAILFGRIAGREAFIEASRRNNENRQ